MDFLPLFGVSAAGPGYPKGVRATTLIFSGTPRISFTSFSLKAPIQQVPSPNSVAARIRCSRAMAISIG